MGCSDSGQSVGGRRPDLVPLESRKFLEWDVAADPVARVGFGQRRLCGLTDSAELARAARVEGAAAGRIGGTGYLSFEADALARGVVERGHCGQQRLGVGVMGAGEDALGWANLHDPAEVEDRYPVREVAHDSEVAADGPGA